MSVVGVERARFANIALTDIGLHQVYEAKLFGRAIQSFPLPAIDSVFVGWRRHKPLLVVSMLALIVGLALTSAADSMHAVGTGLTVAGIAALVAFILVKPTRLEVRSGRAVIQVSLNGSKEAEAFAHAVLVATGAALQPLLPVAVPAVARPVNVGEPTASPLDTDAVGSAVYARVSTSESLAENVSGWMPEPLATRVPAAQHVPAQTAQPPAQRPVPQRQAPAMQGTPGARPASIAPSAVGSRSPAQAVRPQPAAARQPVPAASTQNPANTEAVKPVVPRPVAPPRPQGT